MSVTIRVDDDVYESLKAQAEAFVDTPNTVLRRLLGLDPDEEVAEIDDPASGPDDSEAMAAAPAPTPSAKRATKRPTKKAGGKRKAKRTRAPSGQVLPEDRYHLPILRALDAAGGAAPSREVVEAVGRELKDDLTELDRERLDSGGIRWESRVQFARLSLMRSELMEKHPQRGVWAISDKGRAAVQEAAAADEG